MANLGSKGYIEHIDDPAVTTVNATAGAGVTWALSSDSSDTAFARAVAAGKGYYYTGALAATADNMIEFCSNNLIFAGQEGYCMAEVMLQFSAVTAVAFNFGFNDDVQDAGNTLPVELGTTTFTLNNGGTFCGFVYDTGASNDDLHCIWADDSSLQSADSTSSVDGKSLRMSGMAPTASKWLYMRVELQDRGSGNGLEATFLAVDHNGRSMEKTFNTTVDRDCPLCFYLAVENRAATAISAVDIKCPNWYQTIADM